MVLSIRCCQYEKSWMEFFIFLLSDCYPSRDCLFDKGITLRCQLSYTEIGRHIINQSNNVIYEDRKNQVYGIG